MPMMPLAELARYFPGVLDLPGRMTPRTMVEYRRDAEHYLRWCDFDLARVYDPASCKAWIAWMASDEGDYSAYTINRRLGALKTLMRLSAAVDGVDPGVAFRFAQIERTSLAALRSRMMPVHVLSPEQVRALVRAPDAGTLIGLRDRALLQVLATSGVRISELVALTVEDILVRVSPEGQSCLLRIHMGKGQWQSHFAPLSLEAKDWVDRWLIARVQAGVQVAALFTVVTGSGTCPRARAMSANTAWNRIKRYGKQVGLPWLQPRDLRRFVATQIAYRHGLRDAQLALRHRSIMTTTMHYLTDALKPNMTDELF